MFKLLRTSIVFRSAALVLFMAIVGGIFFAAAMGMLATQQRRGEINAQLSELIDTVENSASIACFLGDRSLAKELSLGLLKSRAVAHVEIRAGDTQLALAEIPGYASNGEQTSAPLVRDIVSPFDAKQIVGQIIVVPNEKEIRSQTNDYYRFIALILIAQTAAVAIAVVVVVIRVVVKPIKQISDRLHGLEAEIGELLQLPAGHELDEIGRLASDVNGLISNLAKILGEERMLSAQLQIEEERFRTIFENAGTGIFVINRNGILQSFNPAFTRFLGISETEAKGTLPMLPNLFGSSAPRVQELIGIASSERCVLTEDFLIFREGASNLWLNLLLNPIGADLLQGILNDITERKQAETNAFELAVTDPLTGLANRLGYQRQLDQLKAQCSQTSDRHFCLMMVDLDGFKLINDNFGHEAGDKLLIGVAQCLLHSVRKADFVARLGGDEFVVILDSLDRRELVEQIAQKILDGLKTPIPIAVESTATIGASIGISLYSGWPMSFGDVMRRADAAMYRAKQRGKNQYYFAGSDL